MLCIASFGLEAQKLKGLSCRSFEQIGHWYNLIVARANFSIARAGDNDLHPIRQKYREFADD